MPEEAARLVASLNCSSRPRATTTTTMELTRDVGRQRVTSLHARLHNDIIGGVISFGRLRWIQLIDMQMVARKADRNARFGQPSTLLVDVLVDSTRACSSSSSPTGWSAATKPQVVGLLDPSAQLTTDLRQICCFFAAAAAAAVVQLRQIESSSATLTTNERTDGRTKKRKSDS